jgi:hypothetical protein
MHIGETPMRLRSVIDLSVNGSKRCGMVREQRKFEKTRRSKMIALRSVPQREHHQRGQQQSDDNHGDLR